MDESRIKNHIKPLLGNRIASSIRISDVEGMQNDIVDGKTARAKTGGRGGVVTGGAGVAGRAAGTLQSILSHADRKDQLKIHPSRGVRKLAGKRKKRRLSEDEIRRLGVAIQWGEAGGDHPTGIAVVKMLILTGFRISEAQKMHRSWLDATAGYVAFPDTKGDEQIRVIGPSAMAVALAQPEIGGTDFLFPSDSTDGAFTAASACLARLCKIMGLLKVTPHTLRHTFGSVAGDLGFSELTIAALLGHGPQSVTQGYVHVDEALKLAVLRTSERISHLLEEGAASARLQKDGQQAPAA
jgi:integrase